LVWPVFLAGILVAFRRSIFATLDGVSERIRSGADFKFGAGGLEFGASPPRSVDQDELYEKVVSSVRDILRTELAPDLPKERLTIIQHKVDDSIRKNAFLVIDSTPLLGNAGGKWNVSYYQYRTVSALLDDIWATVGTLPVLSFGKSWTLEVDGRRLTDQDMGRRWAARHGDDLDNRPLSHPDVGIKPGMRLRIMPGPESARA
jgi:hypothetical protein